jgi:thiol-disulfide isomerase/thioredoxin
MWQKKYLYGSIALLFTAGVLYGLYFLWVGVGTVDSEETFSEEYELALQDYDGHEVRLSSFRSAPLIVFTYASWCPFCADELRRLSRMKEEYGDRIGVVAINRAEPLIDAKAFTDQLDDVSNVLYLLDPEDAYFKSVNGYAMPETVFIQSFGKIFAQHRGPLSDQQLRTYIDDMLR